jgi:hypothetical protein
MVTKVLVGFLKKSSANSGITSIESGKLVSKVTTSFLSFSKSKFSPQRGMNKVQVKLPSKLGNAINIYSPRGQI